MKYWILAFAFVVTACQSSKNSSGHFFDAVVGKNQYEELFYDWTKEKRTQSEFDLVLLAKLTYWPQELRKAYVSERTQAFDLSAEESKALAYEQLAEHDQFFTFVLTAISRDKNWNDFTSNNSLWKIVLQGSEPISPARIEQIPYNDQVMQYFYPTMTRFGETYKLLFPKTPELKNAQKLKISITGPRGRIDFEFENPDFMDASPL